MEYIEIYIGIFVTLSLITITVFIKKNKNEKPSINVDEIIALFNKDEIISVEFIRNKIVVNFRDVSNFNLKLLNDTFAKGITVVGDKIKFYVSDDLKVNEEVFNSIKTFIER